MKKAKKIIELAKVLLDGVNLGSVPTIVHGKVVTARKNSKPSQKKKKSKKSKKN